ncbi:MAG: hypothetical protein ACRDE5_15600, partial [Ginsengibacter sp.]
SDATMLHVQLWEGKRKIYLYYKDNGKGFPNQSVDKNEGIGLNSLQNRATMMGGKMSYDSYQESGTEYFFEIPLIKNKEEYDTNRNS